MNLLRESLDLDELFGKDRAQEDSNLEKYFVKTKQYQEIYSGNKELVLGRKGAGKSSLFSILGKELPRAGKIVVSVSPKGEDYVQIKQNVQKYMDISLDEDFKYALVWKDFIISELSLAIIEKTETPELKKYLKENGKVDDSFAVRFTKSIFKVFGDANLKAKAGDMEVGFNINFSELFSVMNSPDLKKVKEEIESAVSKNEFFVLFDNLDEPWKNNKEMNSWLRGLILSMRQLKRDFNNLKLVSFLRNDIFDEISKGSDLFDSRSEITRISWVDDNNYSLKKLLATRVAVYFDRKKPSTLNEFDDLWKLIFPEKVNFKSGKWIWASKYVIDRTFSRPREFLQFCRLAIEKSRSKNIPVPYDSIISASREFSDWKLSDLVGEHSKTYTNIDACILSSAGATDRSWKASHQKLIKHFDETEDDQKIFSLSDDRYLNSVDTVKFLHKCGFLRQVIGKDKKRFLTYEDENFFNPKSATFDVHPAFRNKLSTHG
ncbi:hypothetical protein Q3O59_06325 [Alkalimonas delamerensis]|uniref:Uncharacterized protein n=1 Tax=Alkalimonas delamerensis TaxID=265981 RepID=A0ABT9GNW2_9GAMM|nr:hypothetical protein [Alkalimonas delamerensis]MDP4528646.1 hypothetical protein [Alkalimonas delamerensis]